MTIKTYKITEDVLDMQANELVEWFEVIAVKAEDHEARVAALEALLRDPSCTSESPSWLDRRDAILDGRDA